MFKPKIVETLRVYKRVQFYRDLVSGLIVGLVALPLAIAFAIASGVSPEKGLYTAIVAGFIISALGGSRVQIGGPTGAFIVVVYGIVLSHGVSGLVIATFLAGILLVIMGLARLGSVIKFIPYPLIVGFTSGIAVIIFSSEIKDLFGLNMGQVPAAFYEKWRAYILQFKSFNIYAFITGAATILIIISWPKLTRKIPGSLIAILVTTAIVYFFKIPVETIGSRFGVIDNAIPHFSFSVGDLDTVRSLIKPAFTIAMLGGIESLLSAVVADGMIGGHHKSNMELVAQGTANIFSSLIGGIPATGAIARTVTNIRNGGRTPVAGIAHALTLLLILLFFGKLASLIPLATLAGILIVVAYNMSEWENFLSVLKGPGNDALILIITFLLTILVDLTAAIEVGMVLASFLFMRKMIQFSSVNITSGQFQDETDSTEQLRDFIIPRQVEVFEISGPLFFGAAYKFKDAIRIIEKPSRVLIIRMGHVPIIDATGIRTLKEVQKESSQRGTKVILSEVTNQQILGELGKARLLFSIGKANVTETFKDALSRAAFFLSEHPVK
jgi:sulfate permease, SulP family